MALALPRPTMRDVARLARVSTATVSLILSGRQNGEARISPETRQRVLAAVAKLKYVPNQTARNLRRQRTDRVCLMVSRLGVPYYERLSNAVQDAAEARGYSLVIAVGGTPERERHVYEQLQRGLADGVVMVNPYSLQVGDVSRLARAGLAVVVLSNQLVGRDFDSVQTTESEACHRAMAYLIDKGHRRIAFLGSFSERLSHRIRCESYRRALAEHRIPVPASLIQDDAGSSREKAYRKTCGLLELPERPTAVLAASDIAAVSAIWAIRDAGLRVPEDVAVIGVGNIPEGGITRPPLTTVGPTASDWSHVTALLFSRLESSASIDGRVHLTPWTLIVRGSA